MLDPKLAMAWSNRGAAKHSKGDHQGTISDCTEALEDTTEELFLAPSSCHLWTRSAALKLRVGDTEGPAADALCCRGLARLDQGDVEDAISDLRQAIGLDTILRASRVGLGRALLRQGDSREAAGELRKAMALPVRTGGLVQGLLNGLHKDSVGPLLEEARAQEAKTADPEAQEAS